jgi:hypothetical protein
MTGTGFPARQRSVPFFSGIAVVALVFVRFVFAGVARAWWDVETPNHDRQHTPISAAAK